MESLPTIASQIDALIPPDRNIQIEDLKSVQQRGWMGIYVVLVFLLDAYFGVMGRTLLIYVGQICTPHSRAMYWRIALGLVSNSQSSMWKVDLCHQISDYIALQKEMLPDISSISHDPLSHMLSDHQADEVQAPGWDKYFEVCMLGY